MYLFQVFLFVHEETKNTIVLLVSLIHLISCTAGTQSFPGFVLHVLSALLSDLTRHTGAANRSSQ